MTSVLIADDQGLVRAGFRSILEREPDIDVVGEAADGVEGLDLLARTPVDVVLMDIRMPRLDGIATTRLVRQRHPDTKVVVLTTYDLDEYLLEALRAGANGFLLKDVRAEQLPGAVRSAVAGDVLLSGEPTRRLAQTFIPAPAGPSPLIGELSGREREVLELVARDAATRRSPPDCTWVRRRSRPTSAGCSSSSPRPRGAGHRRLRERRRSPVNPNRLRRTQ